MALSVKKAVLWRRELENRPGTLAQSLKPLAKAAVGLQIIMGYTSARKDGTSAMEVFPIADAKAEQAAAEAGLKPANDIHCLMIEGDDQVGLGYDMTNAVAGAGINLHFFMCQAVNKKFVGVFGFGSDQDAQKASGVLTKALSQEKQTIQ